MATKISDVADTASGRGNFPKTWEPKIEARLGSRVEERIDEKDLS